MSEHKETSELQEEVIALEKLERFFKDKNFAIRYMNEAEYEEMLKSGIPSDREVILKNEDSAFTGKSHLLSGTKNGWSDIIGWDTNWGSGLSNTDVETAEEIIQLMQDSHSNIDKQKGETRKKFLLKLADALESYQSSNPDAPIRLKNHSNQPIREFRNDPLSYDRKKLREFLNQVSRKRSDERDEMQAQYHILAVFSPDALQPNSQSWRNQDWKITKREAKPDDLLAAFSILPQKDLYQDMIRLASNAGDLAHPIFDDCGVLRWPLQ